MHGGVQGLQQVRVAQALPHCQQHDDRATKVRAWPHAPAILATYQAVRSLQLVATPHLCVKLSCMLHRPGQAAI
jgi:hypothetical protein